MKVVINPSYSHLSDFVFKLPEQTYSKESIIRDNRNVLSKVTVDGCTMVVKKYKKPSLFNRFIYSFFRKTKTRRAYEYALRLEELGVGTAAPVAYIEQKRGGLFHTGYFVSMFLPYPLMTSYSSESKDTADKILDDFITFTASIHEKGIIHYDYNFSNILYNKEGDSYRFYLIDINRMKFGCYSQKKCVRVLRVIGLDLPLFISVNERYANLRGWNPEFFCAKLLIGRARNNRFRRRKVRLKKFLGIAKNE